MHQYLIVVSTFTEFKFIIEKRILSTNIYLMKNELSK